MRDFLSYVFRAVCLPLALVFLIGSTVIAPALAQQSSAERSTPSTDPPSIEASTATNASSLRSTTPAQTESEFKNPPHVYDMKSIREFDRQVYQTQEQPPQRSGDRTSR